MSLVPNPWNGGLTVGAGAIAEPVLPDAETMTFNENRVAVGTHRILPSADVTWEIARIYVAEAGGSPDLGSTD